MKTIATRRRKNRPPSPFSIARSLSIAKKYDTGVSSDWRKEREENEAKKKKEEAAALAKMRRISYQTKTLSMSRLKVRTFVHAQCIMCGWQCGGHKRACGTPR